MTTIKNWRRNTPEQPIVDVERWRLGVTLLAEQVKGDIASTSIVSLIGNKKPGSVASIQSYFTHNGLRYVCADNGGNWHERSADCYELVELAPGMIPPARQKYCYSGEIVTVKGARHVLARPIRAQWRSTDQSELRWMLRNMYGYGGYFAAKEPNYRAFLETMREDYAPDSTYGAIAGEQQPAIASAIAAELRDCGSLPASQKTMSAHCLHDPLLLSKPWLKHPAAIAAKAPRTKIELPMTADDHLASLIDSLRRR